MEKMALSWVKEMNLIAIPMITTTSANIQWESDIDPVSWTFEYMPTSLLNGLAESSKTTTSYLKNYSLANLEPGTEYTIRIQANCGSGNLGAVRSYTFHTSSDPIQLPFNEYFDNAMRPQLPTGWKGMGNVGTNYSYDVTYPYRVRLVDSHYYTEESILISPEFEKALSSVRLSFDALITYSNKNQIIHIGTMSDPADESSFTAVFTFDLFEILESHNHKRIVTYLNNFTTDKHIAIKLENNSTAYFNYLFY
jgi:hypothetical protein